MQHAISPTEVLVEANDTDKVFRVYDPVAKTFLSSGHGTYSKHISVWTRKSSAVNAMRNMPSAIKDRLVVITYRLVEVGRQ